MTDSVPFLSRFIRPAVSRRTVLTGAAATLTFRPFQSWAQTQPSGQETETHGLSSFGDLLYPADFPHFAYVNPDAPKGGTLTLQIRSASGNQNFDTFNTLNIFVLRGDGAAGMDMIYDTLMASCADEPSSMYGLLARAVRVSADKLTYKFLLRPEARFHDGSRVTAEDVAFSFNILKEKGHPIYRSLLAKLVSAEAEGDDVFTAKLAPNRNRDMHLIIASMPVFSKAYWAGKDFENVTLDPPLGSGPYKVGKFDPGRFIEFERVSDYWGDRLPVNKGTNNFNAIWYEYYRDRFVAFEAFKAGRISFNQEYTSRIWATGYDFPAVREGRIKREEIPNHNPSSIQGWHFNLRREQFKDPRIRQALGLAFDFEWVNKNVMYSLYNRLTSYFQNSDMEAKGLPSPAELALLEPFRASLPATVFGEPIIPPVSDGSGRDRALLKKASDLLLAAGCVRKGTVLHLPSGQPFTIEFLSYETSMQSHEQALQRNLETLGIQPKTRIVDAAQYQARLNDFDFDITSRALGGSTTPGEGLDNIYGSEGATRKGSRNIAGISDPAVDALIEVIAKADSREALNVACRALDRILRAGYYWIPMWYKATDWVAYWDEYSRPTTSPRHGSGAPATWWYDADKAKRIGRAG